MPTRPTSPPRWPVAAVAFALAVSAAPAAAQLRGAAAPLVGVRTETPGQIVTGDRYLNDLQDMTLNWSIVLNGGVYTYTYTITGFGVGRAPRNSPDISHLLLGLSGTCASTKTPYDGATRTAGPCVIDPEFNGADITRGEVRTFSPADPGNSNPSLPGSIYGVKFDVGAGSGSTYSFQSLRAPVWGDFYFKGGNASFAYNAGLANNSNVAGDYIAVPDTFGVVPEPSSVALVAGGLAASGVLLRRRRNA